MRKKEKKSVKNFVNILYDMSKLYKGYFY